MASVSAFLMALYSSNRCLAFHIEYPVTPAATPHPNKRLCLRTHPHVALTVSITLESLTIYETKVERLVEGVTGLVKLVPSSGNN